MDPVWCGVIVRNPDGSHFFDVENLDGLVVYLGRYKEGTPIDLIVREHKESASLPQMRYYFGVIVKLISDDIGHTKEEVDALLKERFLSYQDDETKLTFVRSKTSLTTSEFQEYCESCRRWASAYFSLNIPEPNEVEVTHG